MSASRPVTREALIDGYVGAIRAKSADALADLYAPDAIHAFPFNHGEGGVLRGREAVRAFYQAAWGKTPVVVRDIRNLATFRADDGETVIAEFDIDAIHGGTGAAFTLACVVVARVRDGAIVSLRDYTDDLTIARMLGR